ncbi:MAG TPA: hypothetical protein VEF04_10415, partial [Blastocatellia bacterium]|nr:hypothetical protein [Blastocatellia bacterium]
MPKKSYDKLLAVMAAPEKKAEQDTTPKRKYRYKRKVSGIKVVEIRHLEDEDWVEKLEVEIKNISDKPIYYIRFSITLDEIHLPPTYYPFGFTKIFGNDRHMNPGSLAEPDDESI